MNCRTCTGTLLQNLNLVKGDSEGNWCTGAYLINNKFCKKLLNKHELKHSLSLDAF